MKNDGYNWHCFQNMWPNHAFYASNNEKLYPSNNAKSCNQTMKNCTHNHAVYASNNEKVVIRLNTQHPNCSLCIKQCQARRLLSYQEVDFPAWSRLSEDWLYSNGCMLYYKDDKSEMSCKFCDHPCFKLVRTGKGKFKQISYKQMWYLPLIPRL